MPFDALGRTINTPPTFSRQQSWIAQRSPLTSYRGVLWVSRGVTHLRGIEHVTTGTNRSTRLDVGDHRSRDMSKPLPSALSWTVFFRFAAAPSVAYFAADLPLWIPALYLVMSIGGFHRLWCR